ncbi:MAG: organic solvent ABC transporter, partial [Gammaproteobacteria bacterium]|nr:organic solvent ABC transporter [Gammaproteobacteria bacterium]
MTFRPLIPLVLATAVLAAAPFAAQAQSQAAAPSAVMQGESPSKLVLDNRQRVLSTLESRRAEF